jgi:hypothetical protein
VRDGGVRSSCRHRQFGRFFFQKKVGSGLLARAVIGQFSRKLAGVLFSLAFLICFGQKKQRFLEARK